MLHFAYIVFGSDNLKSMYDGTSLSQFLYPLKIFDLTIFFWQDLYNQDLGLIFLSELIFLLIDFPLPHHQENVGRYFFADISLNAWKKTNFLITCYPKVSLADTQMSGHHEGLSRKWKVSLGEAFKLNSQQGISTTNKTMYFRLLLYDSKYMIVHEYLLKIAWKLNQNEMPLWFVKRWNLKGAFNRFLQVLEIEKEGGLFLIHGHGQTYMGIPWAPVEAKKQFKMHAHLHRNPKRVKTEMSEVSNYWCHYDEMIGVMRWYITCYVAHDAPDSANSAPPR